MFMIKFGSFIARNSFAHSSSIRLIGCCSTAATAASRSSNNHLSSYVTKLRSVWKNNFNVQKSSRRCKRNRADGGKAVGGLFLTGTWLAAAAPVVKAQNLQFEERTRLVGLKDESKTQDPKFDWEEFLKLVWPEIWYLLGAVVSALAVALVNIQIPVYLGDLVNIVSKFTSEMPPADYIEQLRQPVIKLISIYGVQGILTFVYISLLQTMGERISVDLKTKLFDSIVLQDIEFFDRTKTGEIVNRLTTDVHDFKSAFKMCISQGLRSFTQVVGSTVSLFLISPKLTGLMVAVVPAIVVLGTLIGASLRKLSKAAQAQVARAAAVADEAISNIRTVRAFATEQKEQALYNQEVQEACYQNEKLGIGIAVFQGLANFALNGIVLGVIYAGGFMMSEKELTAGQLMSFLVATQTIQKSLAQMSLLFGHAVRGMGAGARVFQYIKMQPSILLGGDIDESMLKRARINDHTRDCIQFRDVSFAYPTRPDQIVLDGYSLNIPSGKVVALCGLSGAGKSTVAALLERFYDIDSGDITICDKPLRSLDPQWLRGQLIGYINQEPQLFATSIRENIRYGQTDATDTQVEIAARLANAHEFIVNFPDGYDTRVGERGATVSGGQKQRIAIARALLKNPAILILDEATSALDAESERLVQQALDRVMRGRTVIVIAHRLSTIKNADLIAVMKDGKVAEIGKHNELLKSKGIYWNLIRQQQIKDEAEEKTQKRKGFLG
ncbi:mitochondrial potassium channel ATP-binding subunit-like [Tubulanus polymorphus]|uniref:mitochondrial potassium channel ATP-binding subunit-like n=1 Tax=Tubulanus polymorphus TaxID=672921 RepID=UPI003DA3346A